MIVSIVLLLIAFVILFKYFNKSDGDDFPVFRGYLPVIGHLLVLLKDMSTTHVWNCVKSLSMAALENDGCISFSLGPTKFIVSADPDDCLAILNTNPEKHYVYDFLNSWLGKGLLTADYETWSSHKKLIYPMFGQQRLNTFMPIFNKQAKRMVERFAEKVGKGDFNHEPDAMISGLETICQTALGSDVGERMTSNNEFVKAINGMLYVLVDRFKKYWWHSDYLFNLSPLKRYEAKCLETIHRLSKELVQKRKQRYEPDSKQEEDLGDIRPFIDALLEIQLVDESFTDTNIRDEVNTLIITGYETTATGLVYVLMLLGHYPHIQLRLYEEIQEVFSGTDRDVDKTDFSKLVYLDAVMKESLRVYPLVSLIARRVTTDVKLKKHVLQAGSASMISLYGLHRHPDWGPDADEFRPERWLSPETLPKNPNLYAPFGLGKRYCVGKTYAMMAMKTSLIHILRRYKIKADFSKVNIKMEVVTKPATGQHISLDLRNP